MKKIALIALAALISGTGPASASKIKIRFFEVDHEYVFQVTDGVPGSEFALYSRKDGGKELYTDILSPEGRSSFTKPKTFKPAFILNKKQSQVAKAAGNDMVATVGESLFTLNNIRLQYKSGNAILSWEAGFSTPAGYTLEVLRSTDNETYLPIYTPANLYNTITEYSFRDDVDNDKVSYYKIHIKGTAEGVDYTSNAYRSDGNSQLAVYPTQSQTELNVNLYNTSKGENITGYTVVDMSGKVLMREDVSGNTSFRINIANLLPGNYVLHVLTGRHGTKTSRFIR